MTIEQLNLANELNNEIESIRSSLKIINDLSSIERTNIKIQCESDDKSLYMAELDTSWIEVHSLQQLIQKSMLEKLGTIELKFRNI